MSKLVLKQVARVSKLIQTVQKKEKEKEEEKEKEKEKEKENYQR